MDPVLLNLGIALGLGLLVGLQRTWSMHHEAGVRTFPLITLLGFVSGSLAAEVGGWVVAAGLLGVAGMLIALHVGYQAHSSDPDLGITTEVAALVMYGVGAALTFDFMVPALVTGGSVAVLLQWKGRLHSLAERMGQADLELVIQLVLVALVILPVLPNEDFGPYAVLNPFEIWLMVVLIVGISAAGYVAFKLFGHRTGAVAAGVLGGLISSTATTVSYARRTREKPERSAAAAVVVMLASVVVFGRVMVEALVVAPELFGEIAPPLAAMMAFMALVAGVLFVRSPIEHGQEVEDREPPSDLRAAIVFGVLYAAVLLAVAFARENLGEGALYVVAGISGLTDVDAITLSTAQLMKSGTLDTGVGWRIIQVGALANLVFKGGVAVMLGHRRLRARILTVFGVSVAGGVALLLFWPG